MTPLDEGSARLPDNTQRSQETDIHSPGGIRTRNLSQRSAAVPRLRPLDHWDRHKLIYIFTCIFNIYYIYINVHTKCVFKCLKRDRDLGQAVDGLSQRLWFESQSVHE